MRQAAAKFCFGIDGEAAAVERYDGGSGRFGVGFSWFHAGLIDYAHIMTLCVMRASCGEL